LYVWWTVVAIRGAQGDQ